MNPDASPWPTIPLPMATAPVRQYEVDLIRLHELRVAGLNDSDDAELVRDGMDGPWAAMSPAERDLVGGLSADLYMLDGREVREPADGPDGVDALDRQRGLLYAAGRWAEFLRLLRRGPTNVQPSYIAYCRHRAYEGLGLQSAAMQFVESAIGLDPRDLFREVAIVHAQRLRDTVTAVRHANAAIDAVTAGPGLLVMAAGAVLASTKGVATDLASPQWHRVIGAVDRALASPAIDDRDRVNGLVYQGLALEFLGRGSDARSAFAAAAAIAPFDPFVSHARAGQPVDANRAPLPSSNVDARLLIVPMGK